MISDTILVLLRIANEHLPVLAPPPSQSPQCHEFTPLLSLGGARDRPQTIDGRRRHKRRMQ
jgi:hypothetical protein